MRVWSITPENSKVTLSTPAYLFGYLRMFRGRHRIGHEVNRKKGLHILLWFLLNPGKPCLADQFVEALWPDMETDRAI